MRSHLLKSCFLCRIEDVAVLSEEDEVSLVVDGDDASTVEVWTVREERADESADGVSESGVEVVEDELRCVFRHGGVTVDLFGQDDAREFEECSGSIGEVNEQHTIELLVVLVYDDEVSESPVLGIADNRLQAIGSSRIVVGVGYHTSQFNDETVRFLRRLQVRRDHHLRSHFTSVVIRKFIRRLVFHHLLIGWQHKRLIGLSHRIQSLGLQLRRSLLAQLLGVSLSLLSPRLLLLLRNLLHLEECFVPYRTQHKKGEENTRYAC